MVPSSSKCRGLGSAARVLLAAVSLSVPVGCEDDPGASVMLTDVRSFRDPAKNVVVDVDVVAHEALGGNVGMYCVRVVFVDPTDVRQQCASDLEDGDSRTVRIVGSNIAAGTSMKVDARLVGKGAMNVLLDPRLQEEDGKTRYVRTLVAPP